MSYVQICKKQTAEIIRIGLCTVLAAPTRSKQTTLVPTVLLETDRYPFCYQFKGSIILSSTGKWCAEPHARLMKPQIRRQCTATFLQFLGDSQPEGEKKSEQSTAAERERHRANYQHSQNLLMSHKANLYFTYATILYCNLKYSVTSLTTHQILI